MDNSQSSSRAAQDDELEFGEIIFTLRRFWRRIAALTAVCLALALISVLFSVPKFATQGSMYLGDANQAAPTGANSNGLNSLLSDFQTVSDINTQVELIKSKSLVQQAILESGLNVVIKRADFGSSSYWKWAFFRHHSIIAFAPQPGDLQAVDTVMDDPPATRVTFTVVMGDKGQYRIDYDPGLLSSMRTVLTGRLGEPVSGGGLSLLLRPAIAGAIPPQGSRFKMTVSSAEAVEDVLQVSNALTVKSGGTDVNPTKIANLQILSANPYTGRLFLNSLMTDFVTTQISWNNQGASATEAFISNELEKIKKSLNQADRELAEYQVRTGIIDVPEDAKAIIGQLSQYEVQRTDLALQQEALQQLYVQLDHPAGSLNPYLLSQSGDAVLSQLASQLASEEAKLQALLAQFTSTAPDVQVEQAIISKIRDSIRTVIGNELALSQVKLLQMDRMISQFNDRLKNVPGESLKVTALTRASDVYGQIYVLLMQKEEEAEISKASSIIDTRIVTPAELPLRAATPKVVITLAAGLLVGLFAGIVMVLAQRAFSRKFQSEEEVRRLVDLPVYGVIPRRTSHGNSLAILPHAQSPFSEAIRALRGSIARSASPQQSRVLLFTSSGVHDGKTTIAANLAKMMADSGKRIVLVDADLHRGRLAKSLDCEPGAGLTEWLVTMNKPNVCEVPGQRFMMLAAGILPPNPSELLHQPYLVNIIANLKADFDYVILDSPPLPAVSDALSLGELADLILSVAMVGHTSRHVFAVHNELLSGLNGRHGIIINGASNAYGYGYKDVDERTNGIVKSLAELFA